MHTQLIRVATLAHNDEAVKAETRRERYDRLYEVLAKSPAFRDLKATAGHLAFGGFLARWQGALSRSDRRLGIRTNPYYI